MAKVHLPHGGWRPRWYQQPFWDAWQKEGKDRLIEIAHRRWGKDEICLHGSVIKMMERPANYWHCFPEYAMARKGIWQAVNAHTGRRRIFEAFPAELIGKINDQEMMITLKNGATWQVIGSDRYNSLVGGGIAGITFSEWALANPSAWAYMRPMLEENGGWAAFITTPRGRNHARAMYQRGLKSERWFSELSNIAHTKALTREQLQEAEDEYTDLYGSLAIAKSLVQQEYHCNFNAAIIGAFYAEEMQDVRNEGRVTEEAQALPGFPVHRAWDIGVKDDTAIWWYQVVGLQILVLDCYAANSAGPEHFAEEIRKRREEHGWIDGVDYVPHDAAQRKFVEGAKTTIDQMVKLGLRPELVPSVSKVNGINAARKTLPRCVFHPRCEDLGLAALEQYRREWDDQKKTFKPTEVHDWASHPADAFRYMSLAWRSAPRLLADVAIPQQNTGFVLDVPEVH